MIDPVDTPLDGRDVHAAIQSITSIDPDLFENEIQTIREKLARGQLHPEAWRLVWRARLFRFLDVYGVRVVDEQGKRVEKTWKEILRDHSGFIESFVFELEIAAVLTAFGLDVAFVHGSGEANAPDLLVDDDIWVECKMRQLERDGRKWSQIKDELLDTVVSPDLQADNTIHSFTITFTDSLDQDDIDELSDTLLRMIENDDTTSEHEQYTVTRTSQSISLSEIEQTLQADPAFQTDPHGRNLQISAYVDENEEITEYAGAEIQFEFDEDWYYPKKIRSRVKEATNKNLSDKEKSAVFVGVPPAYLNTMVDRQTPVEHRAPDAKSNAISQFERLDEEIRYRILNQSQSLNIVCLYSSGILNKIAYCPLIQYWENEECRHPNHDALSDALLEIHRSYTGYLRANEKEDDKT